MSGDPVGPVSGHRLESVDNALQLVLLLAGRDRVGVTEAALALGVAPSTAHRLLAALCRRGFAERDGRHGYRPGFAIDLDGHRAAEDRLAALVRPHLHRLRTETGETVHLMVRDGANVRFIDGAESGNVLRVGLRVGLVLPAHCTSGGKAMLARLAPAELSALYPDAALPPWPSATVRDLATLRRRLAVVRRQGFAVNRGESEVGITAVGVCLTDTTAAPVAALAVVAPRVRASRSWLATTAAALTGAMATIGATLG